MEHSSPGRGFTYLLTLVDIRCSAFSKGLWAPGLRSHQFVSHIRGVGPAEQNQDAVTRVRGNGCWAGISIKQMPQEQCRHKHPLCVCKGFITEGEDNTFKSQQWPITMTNMGLPGWHRIHLPVQETWVRSLDQEDLLEKEMAANSSILAWEIHGQRNFVGYIQSMESQSRTRLSTHTQWLIYLQILFVKFPWILYLW